MRFFARFSIGLASILAVAMTSLPTPAHSQGSLLFEDFSEGLPADWSHTHGRLTLFGGVMTLDDGCVVLPGEFDRARGLAIEADVSIDWAAAGDFNIFAFAQPSELLATGCRYIASTGYNFGVYPVGSDNPNDLVDAVIDGELFRVAAPTVVQPSTWASVRAEITANGSLRLTVDGQEQATNFDTELQEGPLVLRTWGPVRIDSVSVETLQNCDFGPPNQPLRFTRQVGQPQSVPVTWTSCLGTGVLRIINSGVSSAKVTLDGQTLLGPADFRLQLQLLEVPITLEAGDHTLEVEVRGAPGSFLDVQFLELTSTTPE